MKSMTSGQYPGATDADLAPFAASSYEWSDFYRSSTSAFLVESGGKRRLVDAGGAQSGMESLGLLVPTLTAIGIAPDSMAALVMTHLHADHAGGAFDETGEAMFGRAELLVRAEEHAYHHDDYLSWPAFGSVSRDGKGYRFAPAPCDHELGHS